MLILQGFKSFVLEVRILNELRLGFPQVRILRDVETRGLWWVLSGKKRAGFFEEMLWAELGRHRLDRSRAEEMRRR